MPVVANPIDHVWADRPAAPASPVVAHEARFAGKSSAAKRSEIAAVLAEDRDRAVILTAADSIAWLFNIRGADVEHSPLPLSFAALEADGPARLFVDPGRLAGPVREHLEAIRIDAPDALGPYLDGLGGDKARVRICPATAAVWLFDRLQKAGAELHEAPDPCSLPKAVKNDIELEGTRNAHLRDGLALVRFLAWLDAQVLGSVDELGAAERLEALRREGEFFQGLSFPTISGAGANGAIVHYRVTPETNAILAEGLYLVDSGAQYLDGTTDVTRTVAVGGATDEMRRHFTLVLKGHIAMATARFPAGTRGSQLDALARQYLWRAGLDYDHGTGHGVGSYLGVHEGPQRISKTGGDAGLKINCGPLTRIAASQRGPSAPDEESEAERQDRVPAVGRQDVVQIGEALIWIVGGLQVVGSREEISVVEDPEHQPGAAGARRRDDEPDCSASGSPGATSGDQPNEAAHHAERELGSNER